MATTTNYGWDTPDDTDLVKDGAAAIRTLGSSADTTVKNLNPGTTAGDIDYYTSGTAKARIAIGTANQVLQVNSGGTAPEWGVDPVADVVTTAGDLLYATAADTVTRLGIGTAGQVLKVNSGATAPEWGSAGGGKVLQVVQDDDTSGFSTSSTTYQDTGLSVTITPSSASSKVLITVAGIQGYFVHSGSQTGCYGSFRLVRTSTQLQEVNGGGYNLASSSGKVIYFNPNFGYLDSPATTSATTYKVQGKCESGGSTTAAYTASATAIASIIAYEIGA